MILEKDYSNYKFEDKKSLLMAKIYMLSISAKDTQKFMKDYLEKDFVAVGSEQEYKDLEKELTSISTKIADLVKQLKGTVK
jgi:hypothetical protein